MAHCSIFERAFRICLTTCLVSVAFTSTRAVVDLNSDGFDDIWQLFYGAQGLTLNGNADNDGQGDIVWQNTVTGARSFWLMRGTTFLGSIGLGTVSTSWDIAGFSDFNGDGRTDIVWENKTSGAHSIWLMNGVTRSGLAGLGTVSTQWNIAAVGDFNRDGKPDILWQNNVSGAAMIWLMNGLSFSKSAMLPTIPSYWKIRGAGGFTGDGNTDILWQNNLSGACSIWTMDKTTRTNATQIGVFSTQWTIVGLGDFNTDGQPDILWQSNVTGARQIWLMNGTTRTSSVNLPNVPAPWRVSGVGNFSGDGISNLQESVNGTDPFNARSGLRITQTTFGNGTVTLHWPSVLGKQYQVFASTNGAQGNWQPIGAPFAGTGAELVATLNITPGQKFFRITASDLDSDGDGVSDWEEFTVGLNPQAASSDGVTNDYQRVVAALQAPTSTVTVTEVDPVWSANGVTPGTFTINRTGRFDALTIGLSFGGDAVAGTDYQPIQNTVKLPFAANSVTVQITPLSGAAHNLAVTLNSGAQYQIGTPATAAMNIGSPQSNMADVARFLTQATFGPTPSLLTHVQLVGLGGFLDEQFNTAATSTLARVDQTIASLPPNTDPQYPIFQEAWWHTVVTAPDQVRQRVAFALSEIFVVSANGNDMYRHPEGMATYWDLLARNAFGNFRQLLDDVTLNPVMGDYLDMVHNDKPDPQKNTEPNENYAREVMQLFTVGLYLLNPDGTQILDNQNQPIPAYDQEQVEGLAHVFTGWYWAQNGTPHWYNADENYRQPMQAFPNHHATEAKELIGGVTLPPEQTQAKDLKDALDLLFNHPNTGPFVCRQLIQRLVTSNPTPAYIARVAQVFADNGQGVRGDLKAVIRALLLDPEARSTAGLLGPSYGHQREPIIRLINFQRAFNVQAQNGTYIVSDPMRDLAQAPLFAPSVFNFFSPNFVQPGAIAQAGLVAPEFKITTDITAITSANKMRSAVYRVANSNPERLIADYSSLTPLASNPAALVDSLNNLLMSGEMSSAMRDIAVGAVTQIPANNAEGARERAQTAVHLLVTSPEFVIEK